MSVPVALAGTEGEEPVPSDAATVTKGKHDPIVKAPYRESVVVTATATERSEIDLPFMVVVRDRNELLGRLQSRTTPDALESLPGVMIQKTSYGQGSPYLRGFTGFRTVQLVDGVRLNNSVYRDGPNQYLGTVDLFAADRIEIVEGPASVLYGSDAVGGVVNVLTRPLDSASRKLSHETLEITTRYATADSSGAINVRGIGPIGAGAEYTVAGSLKRFGDLEAGGDTGRQLHTGYGEWDGSFALSMNLGMERSLVASHQSMAQDDAWRTHTTVYGVSWEGTEVGSELRRLIDQRRNLSYVRYLDEDRTALFDRLSATVSFQRQVENSNRVKSDGSGDNQGFTAGTTGFSLLLEKSTRAGRWTYGVDVYRDTVDSFRNNLDSQGMVVSREIQGPVADDATYMLAGLFVQAEKELTTRVEAVAGMRLTYARAEAGMVEDPSSGLPESIRDDWRQAVGNARLLYVLDKEARWRLYGGVSQGFRAPNLSDLTRFDTARSSEIETPSPGLDPETYVAYEIGMRGLLGSYLLNAAYFYTDIQGMIIRVPTGTTIGGLNEVTKRNSGDGFVNGVEVSVAPRSTAGWGFRGNVTWMYGEIDSYPTSAPTLEREPMDRLMPVTGSMGLQWISSGGRCSAEGSLTVTARQDNLSTRDLADTQRIPPGGTPGYRVLNLRSYWKLARHVGLSVAIENITDEDYRIHGSGLNEAGRGVIATLHADM